MMHDGKSHVLAVVLNLQNCAKISWPHLVELGRRPTEQF